MARDFNGSTDRIDWANVFTTSGQALTLSMWAWFDDATAANVAYLWVSSPSGGGAGTILYQSTTGNGYLTWFRLGSTAVVHESAADVVTTGVWTHVLATSDGSLLAAEHKIYVNGTEVTYSASQNGATETTANSTWSLGGRLLDNARNFDGRLAEVGVWNRVLSAGEIALLADAYAPIAIPSGLRFWAPLIGSTTEHNRLGAAASTMDGTTIIAHPRVIYPSRTQVLVTPAAAAGDAVPQVWSQYRRRHAG